MKTLTDGMNEPRFWNHIATFGPAKLVTNTSGRVELLGGSHAERTEAREWIALFMHDAVLAEDVSAKPAAPVRCRQRKHLPRPQTFWRGCRKAAGHLACFLF